MPVFRLIIVIGYKYNMWTVIHFIDTEDKVGKNSGIPYLSKYPNPLSNFSIFPC